MGSAASIDNRFSEEIRSTYLLTEEIKEEIATHDARFLKIQSSQAWKDHKKIIAALTERTKSQLQRVARIYSKIEAEEGRTISADMEIRNMLGGSYGDFMRLLVVSVEAINSELLDTALKCIGCDENLISDVLCAIPYRELTAAQNHYNSCHKENLHTMIKSKTLENSGFQKFILKVLTTTRNSELVSSVNEAIQQADELYSAGVGATSNSQKNDEIIFQILAISSRKQCQLIHEQFENKYSMTLEAGLTGLYGGSCLRAIILWVSPLLSAVSSLFYMSLNSVVIDYDHTCHLATKYEKHILQDMIQTYQQIYSENLLDRLSKCLTGNFKKSVIAWFTNPTYDDGNEAKLMKLVDSCDGSIDNLMSNQEKLKELNGLVIAELNSASSHLEETIASTSGDNAKNPNQKMKEKSDASGLPAPLLSGKSRKNIIEPSDSSSSLNPQSISVAVSETPHYSGKSPRGDSHKVVEVLVPPAAAAAIITAPSKRKQLGYEEKFKIICDYLLTRFKQDDIDDSGMLSSAEFWNTLKSLNVGYTDDELEGIQAWVDYDGDGQISYAEVINELADSLIDIIESSGVTVEDKVNELWEHNRIELERLWDEYQTWADQQDIGEQSNMSPSLTQYLKDSFEAFDVDGNGTLDSAEFWNILVTLLGLSDGDRAMMEMEWDNNQDGRISWEEALEEFNKIFRSKVNDKKDFWIGLVDKTTNKFFWFNVRDETSFWMNAEDEERFKASLALGEGRSDALAPAEVPSALLSSKTKSFQGNMKSLHEFKSIKKAIETDS